MNTATASQILGFCSSMFLAQLGHKTIDQITELERISVLTDMKNRRVFGYPELNDPAIRAQFMSSRCYLSLTQKIHSFSNPNQLGFVTPQVANGLVRPILVIFKLFKLIGSFVVGWRAACKENENRGFPNDESSRYLLKYNEKPLLEIVQFWARLLLIYLYQGLLLMWLLQ
jgi:hypothetical protein